MTPRGNCSIGLIGGRFKDHANIIWILGGDRPAPTKLEQDVWRAMARGIAIGVSGREDHERVLMTYHTFGPDSASNYFHEDAWLDFSAIQSSHGDRVLNWKMIERDYQRVPIKPVMDLETTYPELAILKGMQPGTDDHARRSAYWAVFSGAFGHTYGHNSIWQMHAPGRAPVLNARSYWHQALHAPSATQMGYLRGLIESRPFLTQSPDPSLLSNVGGEEVEHVAALRGEGYALNWRVTLPVTEPHQSYVVYYQAYTSAVPDPKGDGSRITGDLAVIVHREDFPFEAWGKTLGEFNLDGRSWRVVQKASAIGQSTYIILIPVTPVARREGQQLVIENFDLKPCLDFCVVQGFFRPADYLLTIQVGWESRVLHGVLRSDGLRWTVGKRGADPVRLPLASSIAEAANR